MAVICWLIKWWDLWEDIFLNSKCEDIFSCEYFTFLWPSKMWRPSSLRSIIFHFWPTKCFIHAFMYTQTYILVACFSFKEPTWNLVPRWAFFPSCKLAYCHFPPGKHPAKYYPFPWKILCVPHWNTWNRLGGVVGPCGHTFHTIQVPHLKNVAGTQTYFFGTLPCLVCCFLGCYRSFWCCYCLSM